MLLFLDAHFFEKMEFYLLLYTPKNMPKNQGNRLWPIVIPKNGLELAVVPGLASASPWHEPVIKAMKDIQNC